MSTQGAGSHAIMADATPAFRIGWRGYDPGEVDEFLRATAADRRRFRECLVRLDSLIAERQQGRAEDLVAAARREADDIRMAAEQEAARVLREAERRAEMVQLESLQAGRREIERASLLRQEVERCIHDAMAALARSRDVLPEPAAPSPPAAGGTGPSTAGGRNVRGWIAFLAAWLLLVAGVAGVIVLIDRAGRSEAAVPAGAHDSAVMGTIGTAGPADAVAVTPGDASPDAAGTPDASATAASGLVVTLTAHDECWISTVVDGGTATERLLHPDETVVIQARDEVVLRAGNAAALAMLINGRPARPLGPEGRVVTTRITRAGHQHLLASTGDGPPL